MNSTLSDLSSWGSGLLNQASAQLAPTAAAASGLAGTTFQQGADFLKKGTKAVKAVVKENAPSAPFVGASYAIDDPRKGSARRVTEVAFLAEGAFGAVLKVTEAGSGAEYAVKKINCQEGVQVASSFEAAEREAKILTSIAKHPNIILCLGYAIDKRAGGGAMVKLLLELCTEGHLLDFMDRRNGKLSAREILDPFSQVTEAVRHLHAQRPPIQHRDLKVENVLRGSDGQWKLCDFGSCSTEVIPAEELSRSRLLELQEDIDKTVTMLYRPPEMCDIELNFRKGYEINEQGDIWMLGCILFTLAFYRHPFQDNPTAMAVTNGKYFIPSDHEMANSTKLCGLIHWLLGADPRDRPSAPRILELLRDIGKIKYEALLAAMPAAIREKIRKLDIYNARRDTGDIQLPTDLASAVAAAGSLAKSGTASQPRGGAQPRNSAGRGAGHGAAPAPAPGPAPASAAAAPPAGFDLSFALAPAGQAAAPAPAQARAQAQAKAPGASSGGGGATLVSDLLSFNTPPIAAAAAAPAGPSPTDLGNLLDLGFPAATSSTTRTPSSATGATPSMMPASPPSDWSADFTSFSPGPRVPHNSPAQDLQAQCGAMSPAHFPATNAFASAPPRAAAGASYAGASNAAGAAGNNAFAFDFADFSSAPPPPQAIAKAVSAPPASGNLLDF